VPTLLSPTRNPNQFGPRKWREPVSKRPNTSCRKSFPIPVSALPLGSAWFWCGRPHRRVELQPNVVNFAPITPPQWRPASSAPSPLSKLTKSAAWSIWPRSRKRPKTQTRETNGDTATTGPVLAPIYIHSTRRIPSAPPAVPLRIPVREPCSTNCPTLVDP
jgi:hypothetical protein